MVGTWILSGIKENKRNKTKGNREIELAFSFGIKLIPP
jgi:hypothetical protein